jgi:hypothetical protein
MSRREIVVVAMSVLVAGASVAASLIGVSLDGSGSAGAVGTDVGAAVRVVASHATTR